MMAHQADASDQASFQLSRSLSALAAQLHQCSQLAEHLASAIGHGPIDPALQALTAIPQIAPAHSFVDDDNALNGRKRKAAAIEDDGKRKRKPKDPNAPKRPPSSYILFQNEIRQEVKKVHPNLTNSELLALISKMWNDLSEDKKNRYNEKCAVAKEVYTRDKAIYDARSPEEKAAADAAAAVVLATKKTRRPRGEGAAAKAAAAKAANVPPVAAEESTTSDADAASDDSEGDDDANGDEDDDPAAESSEEEEAKPANPPPSKAKKPESTTQGEHKVKKQRR